MALQRVLWTALVVLLVASPGWAGRRRPPAPAPEVLAALGFLDAQAGASGLLDSFPGDGADHAYTYDNALAALAYLSAGDVLAASQVLAALAAVGPEPEGGFLHRYRASDGGAASGLLRVGHNAYVLKALVRYVAQSGDPGHLALALQVAGYLLSQQDTDGGLFGAAGVGWKSTENNLAAWAALQSLGLQLGDAPLQAAAADVRGFLLAECWDGTRFLTGENDPMFVTDAQALGVLALGAAHAGGAYQAESETLTTRNLPGGVSVTGFDLNTDGDTVWAEGTLQQALAFALAGDLPRSALYRTEAQKLAQASGGLWQASHRGTTGFGEFFERWEAVAPAAWLVFAMNGDNILAPLP